VSAPAPLLAADSVDARRGGRQVLRAAYVDAVPGAVTALVGRSGAGKTTLFEILTGRRRPDAGQVRWEGTALPRPSLAGLARRGLWYHPDRPWLPPRCSAAELFALAMVKGEAGWGPIASELGVTAWLDRPVGTLSGGELRLTEIALGVALRPRAAVLDEPYRGLEPLHRELVGLALRRLARGGEGEPGAAVLYADHDATAVRSTADRLFSMEEGRTRLVADFRERPLEEWYHAWPR
jgi:branched-chain amino acid transport system ATP-binding protein